MTSFQLHLQRWQDCKACPLCRTRQKMCFVRGKVPCDCLFVGEAPGPSEDLCGEPFIGPAGRLLDEMLADALLLLGGRGDALRFAYTNLLCCFPADEQDGAKFTEPPDWAVKACAPRLVEFVGIAKPRLVVCVGREAEDWLDPKRRGSVKIGDVPQVAVTHPAAILRANLAQRSMMRQRVVVVLANALEGLCGTAKN